MILFLLKEENDSDVEEAENTIRDLYACKEWIRQDVLEDVVRKIIRLVAENQPETAGRLSQRADVFPTLHLSGKPAESMCHAHDEKSKPGNFSTESQGLSGKRW